MVNTEVQAAPISDDHLVDFAELARSIGRHKWGVLALTVLAAAAALLFALSLKPVYRGSVTILIEAKNQRVVQGQDVYDPGAGTPEYYGTQGLILKSHELAERVVERLKLVDNPEFKDIGNTSAFESLDFAKYLPFLPKEAPLAAADVKAVKREAVIRAVMKETEIEQVWGTQLVTVHYKAHSAVLSAQVANTLADLYIESGLQAKLDATRKATEWLTTKLSDIKQQLEQSEASLQAFKEKSQLVTVGTIRSLTEAEIVDYSQRQREAQRKRVELENAYSKVKQAGSDTRQLQEINAVMSDKSVQTATQGVLAAKEAIKQVQERYGDKHPKMAEAKARLDTATAGLNEQIRVAALGIKTDYEISLQNEKALNEQVAQARNRTQKLDRDDYQLSVLQREVTTNRELYDTFLTRFKEADSGKNFESLNARVIDPAFVPRKAYEPNIRKMVLYGAAMGFVLGILLSLLRHLLSESINSAEELEALSGLPVLSALPLVRGGLGGRKQVVKKFLEPHSSFTEGIRSTRASVQLSDVDRRFKRIMVTSSLPKEGKSSISLALAMVFAASERVLLLDADLRKPTQHKLASLPENSKGIADALSLNVPVDDCLHRFEGGGIWVMPAASGLVPNPSELLSSDAFGKLIEDLSGRFDRIVIDTPPCQVASDAMLVSKHAHAALFIVKSDSTPRRAIKNALKRLKYAQAPVLGTVVNQVNVRSNHQYADGYHYVYDYYG